MFLIEAIKKRGMKESIITGTIVVSFLLAIGLWAVAIVFKSRGFYLSALGFFSGLVTIVTSLFLFGRILIPIVSVSIGFIFAFIACSMYRFFLKNAIRFITG
jgi:hypothetical protein